MNGQPTTFWAKLRTDSHGTVVAWHSLVDHSADVAACFKALLERPVIRERLERLAGMETLTHVHVDRLSVLAALHDMGKANIGFQNKGLKSPSFTAGHVQEVLGTFTCDRPEGNRLAEAIGLREMVPWGTEPEVIQRLLIAAICHHGRPYAVGEHHQARIWRVSEGRDPFGSILELAAAARRWFPAAWNSGALPFPAEPRLQHAFCGLLTLADWLGSDEDVRFFPYASEGDPERFSWALERARSLVTRLGIDGSVVRRVLGSERPRFSQVSGFTPRDLQSRLLEMPVGSDGSITVLEAETGSGKTEAALARFLVLLHAGMVDGMYFALPTRTAATQMHERVREALARAFPDEPSRPPVTLAVPGYLWFDEVRGYRLPGFRVQWPDDEREGRRYRGWAAERPKRYLAGAVVVGTVDQVLLSALAVRHSHLRAAPLLRHFLVVDEVHASDAYMNRVLEEVLDRFHRAGGHVLLMSATLGGAVRSRLLNPTQAVKIPSFDESVKTPYPILTHQCDDLFSTVSISSQHPRRIVAILQLRAADLTWVANRALDGATQGARVLVLRNTVRDCIGTQKELEVAAVQRGAEAKLFQCAGVAAPHHSRFAGPDRELLDRAIERVFGKVASTAGCVCVCTQTVQQSLDLDADMLMTDLCPMDVFLQRLGRLHRHPERDRPQGFQTPIVEVLTPGARDLGSYIRKDGAASGPHGLGTVYEDLRMLEATWRLLEESREICIPEMNRTLVEQATHPEALAELVSQLADPWQRHSQRMTGVELANRRLGVLNLANWSAPFDDRACLFPSGGLERRIQTRLGECDRLARFDSSHRGPFGKEFRELTLPAHVCRRADPEAAPSAIEESEGAIRFDFGTRRYVYDRLGLRLLKQDEPLEEETDA